MNALTHIPQSARAMLRTSRLLGVRSSLIFRNEIMVRPFRQKPSRAANQNSLMWLNWKRRKSIRKYIQRAYSLLASCGHSVTGDSCPLMQGRNTSDLFAILCFLLIERPDFLAPSRNTRVRGRELQRRQLHGDPQPAHTAGTHVTRPGCGREMGHV